MSLGASETPIEVGREPAAATITSNLAGSGDLIKTGAGTLTLTGTGSYGGDTTINGGKLVVGSTNALPTGTALGLANASGVALELDYNQRVASLAGYGSVALDSADLTVDGTANTTYSGTIEGLGGLVKAGTGSLVLTGTNSYQSATIVQGGTLTIAGTNTYSSGTTLSGGILIISDDDALGAANRNGQFHR